MNQSPDVKTFAELVTWIADNFHDGSYYALAKTLGVSPALIYAWRDGMVRSPHNRLSLSLCAHYHLDLMWMMKLAARQREEGEGGTPAIRKPKGPRTPAGKITKRDRLSAKSHPRGPRIGDDRRNKRYYDNHPRKPPLHIVARLAHPTASCI